MLADAVVVLVCAAVFGGVIWWGIKEGKKRN